MVGTCYDFGQKTKGLVVQGKEELKRRMHDCIKEGLICLDLRFHFILSHLKDIPNLVGLPTCFRLVPALS